mgnify:CR=1 FL=1
MDLTTALHDVKKNVDHELQHFFTTKHSEAKNIHPQTIQLVDQIADLTSRGGKRTRAFLVWLGHQSVIPAHAGIQRNTWIPDRVGDDNVLSAMMGIELFQSFALIHDDIIDEDAMRRGSPTVHEKFKQVALDSGNPLDSRNRMGSSRFGESMAILAGDLALAWADELMNRAVNSGNPKDSRNWSSVWVNYQKMKQEVILGQSLDVLASAGLPSADRATINRYKTAWYSVVRPLQIGASIAGSDEKTLESFVPYGLAVGEAYQLRDDFLDGEVGEDAFRTQAKKFGKQTAQATQAIHASVGMGALLTDFASFALNRQA